jgi:copper chaperone
MVKEKIIVNGMSCAHCEARVNTALEAVEGVKSSKANAKKNEVVVKFDETAVSLDALKETIREAGYEAE